MIALLEDKLHGFQKCVTLTQHDNSEPNIGIEMQRPQVWRTDSSYHTHGCSHAGGGTETMREG